VGSNPTGTALIQNPRCPGNSGIGGFACLLQSRFRNRFDNNRFGWSLIEVLCHGIEVVIEEIRVHVERHRGGRVPEHSLECFDIGAAADGEACGGVAQVVNSGLGKLRVGVLKSVYGPREPPELGAGQRVPLALSYA